MNTDDKLICVHLCSSVFICVYLWLLKMAHIRVPDQSDLSYDEYFLSKSM